MNRDYSASLFEASLLSNFHWLKWLGVCVKNMSIFYYEKYTRSTVSKSPFWVRFVKNRNLVLNVEKTKNKNKKRQGIIDLKIIYHSNGVQFVLPGSIGQPDVPVRNTAGSRFPDRRNSHLERSGTNTAKRSINTPDGAVHFSCQIAQTTILFLPTWFSSTLLK